MVYNKSASRILHCGAFFNVLSHYDFSSKISLYFLTTSPRACFIHYREEIKLRISNEKGLR